jgi:hypothetical protein
LTRLTPLKDQNSGTDFLHFVKRDIVQDIPP